MFCCGQTDKRPSGQGAVPRGSAWQTVLDLFCFASVLLIPPGLAEKRFAEVGQVVSQGAPQRHTFDLVEATYGQRRQPAIGS
jgi:hypothetical protein